MRLDIIHKTVNGKTYAAVAVAIGRVRKKIEPLRLSACFSVSGNRSKLVKEAS